MKLYKFRSFEKIELTLDIIMNERFYCAFHKDLNDPFEGLFSVVECKGKGMTRPIVQSIARPIVRPIVTGWSSRTTVFKSLYDFPTLGNGIRVCSFSSAMSDIRMWSHYASGHTGCVVEVELAPNSKLFEVNYGAGLKSFAENINEKTKATDILSFKTDHWKYEKEYRIITEDEFYSVSKNITGIYLGMRVKDIHKELVVRSTPKEIPVFETQIQLESVEIIPNKRIN